MFGPISAFMSSVTWATGVSVYSRLGQKYPPYLINFLRASITFPLFFLLLCYQAGGISMAISLLGGLKAYQWSWLTISTLSSYAFADVLFLFSARMIGVPAALSIASSYPLWSAFAGWYFKGQMLSIVNVFGLCMVVGGVITVILATHKDRVAHQDDQNFWLGCILAGLTSFLWCMNAFAITQSDVVDPVALGTTVRIFAAVLLAPSLGFLTVKFQNFMAGRKNAAMNLTQPSESFSLRMDRSDILKSLWIFVFESFCGSLFFFYGISHSSLAIGTALAALAPAISVPIAWLMRTEDFSLPKTLGISSIVLGIWLLVA